MINGEIFSDDASACIQYTVLNIIVFTPQIKRSKRYLGYFDRYIIQDCTGCIRREQDTTGYR